MGRLVRVPRPATSADLPGMENFLAPASGYGTQGLGVQVADNYLERVTKYVPFEVIAFFIFINAILSQAMKSGPGAMMAGFPVATIALGALVVAMVLTPLFIWYVREDGDAWFTNAVVSTLAFPFWAYALGAVAFAGYHDGNLAAILLATFTVVSGLIAPRARRVQKAAEAAVQPPNTRERPQLDLVETNRL